MSPYTDKSSRTVVVTGCSSGIGACVTRGLHSEGYRVIACCRKSEDVEKLLKEGFETLRVDLDNAENVELASREIHRRSSGRIYGLVNNGAYGQPGAVIDLRRDVLRQQFETNVFGTQHLTNLLLPMMLPHGEGRVVQISSILGFICLKFRGAYNASKYALEGLTDTMRLEHAGSGVRFSLVEPGPITSDFRKNAYAMFKRNIDRDASMFRHTYQDVERRLQDMEQARFTLPPEAVLDAVLHALESPRPKVRYRVTTPTKVMALLKRILPDRLMDAFLLINSEKENNRGSDSAGRSGSFSKNG